MAKVYRSSDDKFLGSAPAGPLLDDLLSDFEGIDYQVVPTKDEERESLKAGLGVDRSDIIFGNSVIASLLLRVLAKVVHNKKQDQADLEFLESVVANEEWLDTEGTKELAFGIMKGAVKAKR